MEEEFSKEKKKQLATNRERLIRAQTPICSRTPNENYRRGWEAIFGAKLIRRPKYMMAENQDGEFTENV